MKNKKDLYEKIINAVAILVKKSINESAERDAIHDSYLMKIKGTSAVVIADPCYVLTDDAYDVIWGEQNDYQNGIIGNNIGIVHHTYIGDGGYESSSGQEYGVDAGALGIYDINYCKDDVREKNGHDIRVIELDDDAIYTIRLEYDGGTFMIYINGEMVEEIYTGPDDDDEDYEDEDDEFIEEEDW